LAISIQDAVEEAASASAVNAHFSADEGALKLVCGLIGPAHGQGQVERPSAGSTVTPGLPCRP
jgi:hypothetical protein